MIQIVLCIAFFQGCQKQKTGREGDFFSKSSFIITIILHHLQTYVGYKKTSQKVHFAPFCHYVFTWLVCEVYVLDHSVNENTFRNSSYEYYGKDLNQFIFFFF